MVAFLRLMLFALFIFLIVTVAAFVYLEWWQAILVSFATFATIVYAGKLIVRSAIARLGKFASELFRVQSHVLQGATTDVHSIRSVAAPVAVAIPDDEGDDLPAEDLDWYEIEASLFPAPDARGPLTHWDVDDLRLVPAKTPDREGSLEDDVAAEVAFDRVWIVEDGNAVEPEQSKFHGPRRLRFLAGFPRGIPVWKFRYYFEQFGRIELPATRALR